MDNATKAYLIALAKWQSDVATYVLNETTRVQMPQTADDSGNHVPPPPPPPPPPKVGED